MEDTYPEDIRLSDLGLRIERLFREDKIFLNPNLKISDIAGAVGSNRTYVSAYFNREASSTFYDYVNSLRIEYACRLLKETELSVKIIASESGYIHHRHSSVFLLNLKDAHQVNTSILK